MPANIAARAHSAAMSFAHLAGIGRSASRKAEEDEKDDKDKEKNAAAEDDQTEQDRDDGDSKKGNRAEEEDEDDKDDKSKKSRRAKGDHDAESESEDDDTDAKGDDDEEEMHGKSAVAQARRRERARCAAILGDKSAAKNVPLAASLAFNTHMTREEAIAVLQSTPAASVGNAARTQRNPNLGAGGAPEQNAHQALASSWDRAIGKTSKK